ncbi:hypothetical protein NZK32_03960 [Cyanobium sp. FGCU-52]|nr:hypothetical protein [Cyanobium sp. FGCU52]
MSLKKIIDASEKAVLEKILGATLPSDCSISIEIRQVVSEGDPAGNIQKYLLEHEDAAARRNMVMHGSSKTEGPDSPELSNIQKYLDEHKDAAARRNMVMHDPDQDKGPEFGPEEKAMLETILGTTLPANFELLVKIMSSTSEAGANIQQYLVEHRDAAARRNMVMHDDNLKSF